ncbi:MAG: cutinase transcription factor 1 alpha [Lasallia pustulata]|uniref:Cutinase transcription factor 1 alpha n=1 Tax=Lasallia pustulata TaxID=136370 RepID=A0A5M8Q184_9LECA|nr:MAG: cutinase transcription factor 1 alpha [Lasallia pustulata]
MAAIANGQSSGHGPLPNTTAAPNSQTPGHPSFRRQRASRACETCHARKVRCDAASLGVPCTNCVAFSIECKIPAPKRKKTQNRSKDSDSERGDSVHANSPKQESPGRYTPIRGPTAHNTQDGMPATSLSDAQAAQQATHNSHYTQFMKPKFARAPIKEAGRVAYLGESSNLSLLVHDRHGTTDVVHYPLPDTVKGTRAGMTELDNVEIDILHQRGAFLLPPRMLCDELVESFFKWVAPIVPVINRSRFMRRYRDNENPPSLLLLQAMLLAGSRVCTNPQLMDTNGSTTPAAMTFYKRAKALYDANYEDDRVTIVQALILMGWYWEGPEDVTKNVFYWSRVATIVAQGSGMHRSVEGTQLSRADKRLWKRIWWTLFTRDRSVAVALGRPVHINTEDSDVEMVSEEDFIEDEPDFAAEYSPDPVHVQFFLQYVRLCEIMGLVLSQQYSVASKARRQNAIDLTHSDMALAHWLQNCPKQVYWEKPRHHFWSALLHSNYYTTLCLLHRAHMPPATSLSDPQSNGYPTDAAYPSRNIAFQAAGMITSIIENLIDHDELRYAPAFIVYSLFSALIMHVYQMRSPLPSIVAATQARIQICMYAMKEVSKVWLVAKMVHTLFESILGNKTLEERLQKAAGKRHKRPRLESSQTTSREDPQLKRKYDDLELGFSGTPAPQVSYERSRPQTPAVTPSRELGAPHSAVPATSSIPSGHLRQPNDTFMGGGNSRSNTRPPTPFNPSYSVPASPPELYLVTRNSPPISQSLWENFQPDQLFPDGTNMSIPHFPNMNQQNLDPQLQVSMQSPNLQQHSQMPGQPLPSRGMRGSQDANSDANLQGVQQGAPALQVPHVVQNQNWSNHFGGEGSSPDDSWSNGSSIGQAVPATLNVEDWFQFFGINGDLNGLNTDGLDR